MSDEGRHPAVGVPSVTGWDGESAAKRSRHVDAGEPHQEGDEFSDKILKFQKVALYKELLAARETCEHWRSLCEKHLISIPEGGMMVEAKVGAVDDAAGMLEELSQRLSEEIKRRKGLEFRLAELSTVTSAKSSPESEPAKSSSFAVAEPTGPEHDDADDSELHTLKRLVSDQAALLATLRVEKQDLAAANASITEKLRRIPDEVFEDPRPYRALLADFQALRDDMHGLQRNIRFLQDELASRSSDRQRQDEGLEELSGHVQERLRPLLDSLDSEVTRLRRDRDSMRTLYEKTNSQLQGLSKENANLRRLLSETEKHSKTLEGITLRQEDGGNGSSLADSTAASSGRGELESLYAELEALATAFEEVKVQNVALIKSLAERDETIARTQSEKLKAEFALTQARKEADLQIQKANQLEKISIERLELTERKLQNQKRVFDESEMRLHQRLLNQEELSSKFLSASSELRSLRSRIDSCGQLEGLVAENAKTIERLKSEKSAAALELKSCQERLGRLLEQRGGKGSMKGGEELEMYRKLMKCNSCHLRDKNAVILKCMHCFCRQCLDTRIETRQRKCPNCGEAFGAGDVRTIYL